MLNAPSHRALARSAAAEGSVLLKNSGVLPLALPARVALVGPNAGCAGSAPSCDASNSQCGGYTNFGVPVVTALAAGLNASANGGATVTFSQGCSHGGADTSGFAAAVAAAAAADVVVFVGGDSGALGWNNNTCGEDDDRAELELPGVQADLLDALLGTGKPVVAVLIHGRPMTFVKHNLLSRLGAVVAAWRPGCEGGNAIWDMLSGRVSPSGRLAQSWVRRVGQVKSQASPWYSAIQGDFDQVDYNGDVMATNDSSVSNSWTPAFPFMFGLSYTTFDVSPINVILQGDTILSLVNVTNTGRASAKQVVGVFFSKPLSSFVRNHLSLLAFGKTRELAPGESQALQLTAPVAGLASYDAQAGQAVVEKGEYTITVRVDSATVVNGGTFTITV